MDLDPVLRTLTMLTLLRSGGEWTAADLAERLGTSARTVRRDAQRLRRLGYAVEARPGPGSVYRLSPGVKVPPLLFSADEITALVAGLHLIRTWFPDEEVASSALLKLDQILPRPLRRRAAATDLATEVLQQPGAVIAAATVGVIADAVAADDRLRFRYVDQHGLPSTPPPHPALAAAERVDAPHLRGLPHSAPRAGPAFRLRDIQRSRTSGRGVDVRDREPGPGRGNLALRGLGIRVPPTRRPMHVTYPTSLPTRVHGHGSLNAEAESAVPRGTPNPDRCVTLRRLDAWRVRAGAGAALAASCRGRGRRDPASGTRPCLPGRGRLPVARFSTLFIQ
ncbi:helix-turn-helix transcriptional regulator [Streptomyces sp. WM6378]|uniref:helix-turn-helix transcriptional regulator n=1 Tax=Streptomyces sp. WM6378 TaxID=1415557 RepID=UPI000AC35371|nr:HTH domain-containing protein [Streptomyces sp. WM6378]